MFILGLVLGVVGLVWVFILALCRVASDADDAFHRELHASDVWEEM